MSTQISGKISILSTGDFPEYAYKWVRTVQNNKTGERMIPAIAAPTVAIFNISGGDNERRISSTEEEMRTREGTECMRI